MISQKTLTTYMCICGCNTQVTTETSTAFVWPTARTDAPPGWASVTITKGSYELRQAGKEAALFRNGPVLRLHLPEVLLSAIGFASATENLWIEVTP